MKVLKEETGFSAIVQLNEIFVGTQAEDIEKLKVNIIDALNLSFEDQQITFTMEDIVLNQIFSF